MYTQNEQTFNLVIVSKFPSLLTYNHFHSGNIVFVFLYAIGDNTPIYGSLRFQY